MAPPIESGSENRMVTGCRKLPNSSTSTANTIMMPAPIALAKLSNTSPMISASPNCLISTLAGKCLAAGSAITRSTARPSGTSPTRSAPMTTRRMRS